MESSSLTLIVLSGPTAGASYALEGAVGHVMLGSDPSANIQFEGSPEVIANHARIVIDENGVGVEPASDDAILYLNDDRIDAYNAVKNGDILWMGNPGAEGAVMIQCQLGPARDVTADADAAFVEPPPLPPPIPELSPSGETPFYMPQEPGEEAPDEAEPHAEASPFEPDAPEETAAESPFETEPEADEDEEIGVEAAEEEEPPFQPEASLAPSEDEDEPAGFIEPDADFAAPSEADPFAAPEPEDELASDVMPMPSEDEGDEAPAFAPEEEAGYTAAGDEETVAMAVPEPLGDEDEPEDEPFVEAEPVEDDAHAAYGVGETIAFTGEPHSLEASEEAPPEPAEEPSEPPMVEPQVEAEPEAESEPVFFQSEQLPEEPEVEPEHPSAPDEAPFAFPAPVEDEQVAAAPPGPEPEPFIEPELPPLDSAGAGLDSEAETLVQPAAEGEHAEAPAPPAPPPPPAAPTAPARAKPEAPRQRPPAAARPSRPPAEGRPAPGAARPPGPGAARRPTPPRPAARPATRPVPAARPRPASASSSMGLYAAIGAGVLAVGGAVAFFALRGGSGGSDAPPTTVAGGITPPTTLSAGALPEPTLPPPELPPMDSLQPEGGDPAATEPTPEPVVDLTPEPTPEPAATPVPATPTPTPAPKPTPASRATPTPAPAGPSPEQVRAQQVAQLLQQAEAAATGGNFDNAVRLYDQVLGLDSGNARAQAGKQTAAATAAALEKTFSPGRTAYASPSKGGGPAGFDTAEVGDPDYVGELEFQVTPARVKPGDSFTVRVALANSGKKPIKIEQLSVTTAVNGSSQRGNATPRAGQVSPGQRAVVHEQSGTWDAGTQSWYLEVLVSSDRGDTYRSRLTWK